MNPKQPGLERRIGQETLRISRQHRQLNTFYEVLSGALRRGDEVQARETFRRLCDALEAHFAMEDEFYFPSLHGLRPELEPEITALMDEHRIFRGDLEALTDGFERSPDLAAVARAFEEFAARLAAHEEREERLLERTRQGAPS